MSRSPRCLTSIAANVARMCEKYEACRMREVSIASESYQAGEDMSEKCRGLKQIGVQVSKRAADIAV